MMLLNNTKDCRNSRNVSQIVLDLVNIKMRNNKDYKYN